MAADLPRIVPPLIVRLRQTNADRSLLRPGARVLVAVSGGPDSLALLHALHSLRHELGIEIVAAHLDHRMRGAAGEADAAFVREMGLAWGVPVEIGARDVPALARRTGLSLEEAGRAARYRFFGRAARRTGCAVIATGHTADDRVETVLLHLFRGTGLDGLAGIPARRPLYSDRPGPEVVRPLIDVTRTEVLDYCTVHGLQPRQDVTNASPAFLRNRIRRELLPLLEAEYSPALRRHLLRLSRLAEEETALLDEQARELLTAAAAGGYRFTTEARRHGGGAQVTALGAQPVHDDRHLAAPRICLSRTVLADAPLALARRALRLAVQSVQAGAPPDLAVVERLLSLAQGQCPGFTLPGGRIAARVTTEALILEPPGPVPPFLTCEPVPLAMPGVTPLPWGAGAIIIELREAGPHPLAPKAPTPWPSPPKAGGGGASEEGHVMVPPPPAFGGRGQGVGAALPHAILDRARLAGPLMVRPPRPGDRIQPLGMPGHRKLQDLLTGRKVPRAARRRLPVVCDAEKIVWVAGHCVSEAAKVTSTTKERVSLVWELDPRP